MIEVAEESINRRLLSLLFLLPLVNVSMFCILLVTNYNICLDIMDFSVGVFGLAVDLAMCLSHMDLVYLLWIRLP